MVWKGTMIEWTLQENVRAILIPHLDLSYPSPSRDLVCHIQSREVRIVILKVNAG